MVVADSRCRRAAQLGACERGFVALEDRFK